MDNRNLISVKPEYLNFIDRASYFVSKYNTAGESNPYHNNAHLFGVGQLSCEIIMGAYLGSEVSLEVVDSFNDDILTVMLAGLFHDFGHGGAKVKDDAENIRVAVRAFKRWTLQAYVNIPAFFPEHIKLKIISAIECTQFPHVVDPSTLAEKALRDADVLWATTSGDPVIVMQHLRKEMSEKLGAEITYEDMLEKQKVFMNDLKLFTDPGKELLAKHKSSYLASLEEYVKNESNGQKYLNQ